MRLGTLNRRLVLQTQPAPEHRAVGANGDVAEEWADVKTYWGSVEPLTGRELANALQLRNDVSHKITTHYFGRLVPALARWRIGSRIFNIVSAVDASEGHRQTVCYCTEVATS
mgnify:CR=1 FL=1